MPHPQRAIGCPKVENDPSPPLCSLANSNHVILSTSHGISSPLRSLPTCLFWLPVLSQRASEFCCKLWCTLYSSIFWVKFSIWRIHGTSILILQRWVQVRWKSFEWSMWELAASWMEWERSLRICQIPLATLKSREWKLWISEIEWMWWRLSVMVKNDDLRMPWSMLELDVKFRGTMSKEDEKGGAAIWDWMGLVDNLKVTKRGFKWSWKCWGRWQIL